MAHAEAGEAGRDAATADHASVRVPPPLIYLGGLLAGIGLDLGLDLGEPPVGVRVAGGVLGVAAFLFFDSAAMRRFQAAGTSPIPWRPSSALVTDGPYRFSRNPMYVGMAFLFAGLTFALGALVALALLPVVIVVIDRYVIAREEPYLERRFGEAYNEYRTRVRRWL